MTSIDEDVPMVARLCSAGVSSWIVAPHLAVAAWNTQGCVGRTSIASSPAIFGMEAAKDGGITLRADLAATLPPGPLQACLLRCGYNQLSENLRSLQSRRSM